MLNNSSLTTEYWAREHPEQKDENGSKNYRKNGIDDDTRNIERANGTGNPTDRQDDNDPHRHLRVVRHAIEITEIQFQEIDRVLESLNKGLTFI